MVESEDYSAAEEAYDSWMDPVSSCVRNDKKRRFSEEQVKSLELMFETQTKLEPRKKLQLARELGLHPRQVAIWFQNKRARWKSKQLEREYSSLRADYDALHSKFESVKNEKQLLAKQLQRLTEMMNKSSTEERGEDTDHSRAEERDRQQQNDTEMRFSMSSDDEENKYGILGEKEADLFSDAPFGSSSVQSEPQFCFHQPSWPAEQMGATSQWWDFWNVNE